MFKDDERPKKTVLPSQIILIKVITNCLHQRVQCSFLCHTIQNWHAKKEFNVREREMRKISRFGWLRTRTPTEGQGYITTWRDAALIITWRVSFSCGSLSLGKGEEGGLWTCPLFVQTHGWLYICSDDCWPSLSVLVNGYAQKAQVYKVIFVECSITSCIGR